MIIELASWSDIVDFEVIPVITSATAAATGIDRYNEKTA